MARAGAQWGGSSLAGRGCELPVRVVDDDEAARANSNLLRPPKGESGLQEFTVDLADSLGESCEHGPTGFKKDEDREFPWQSCGPAHPQFPVWLFDGDGYAP